MQEANQIPATRWKTNQNAGAESTNKLPGALYTRVHIAFGKCWDDCPAGADQRSRIWLGKGEQTRGAMWRETLRWLPYWKHLKLGERGVGGMCDGQPVNE